MVRIISLCHSRENGNLMPYFVYILASKQCGVLYIGVTSDIAKRVWEHKEGIAEGFTKTYFVHRLVYYEVFGQVSDAIRREKQLKKWNRAWKIELIEKKNKQWRDLYEVIK